MSSNFWRFASTLEKEFHVPYDRDKEIVLCPECKAIIAKSEVDFKDYTSRTDEDYVLYSCPYCKRVLGTAFIIDNDDRSKIREMWRKNDKTSNRKRTNKQTPEITT
jgi:hypothetical protein